MTVFWNLITECAIKLSAHHTDSQSSAQLFARPAIQQRSYHLCYKYGTTASFMTLSRSLTFFSAQGKTKKIVQTSELALRLYVNSQEWRRNKDLAVRAYQLQVTAGILKLFHMRVYHLLVANVQQE